MINQNKEGKVHDKLEYKKESQWSTRIKEEKSLIDQYNRGKVKDQLQ